MKDLLMIRANVDRLTGTAGLNRQKKKQILIFLKHFSNFAKTIKSYHIANK